MKKILLTSFLAASFIGSSFTTIANANTIEIMAAPNENDDDETINLYTSANATSTATTWLDAFEATVQANEVYAKIGNYGGGTDTKWAAIKSEVADGLGISVQELEDMTGVELLQALFPEMTQNETNIIASGSYNVVGTADDGNNSFYITFSTAAVTALVLNLQLN